ncbi:MAG: transcription-repair coupling factor [Vampirovibrionales bacterium]|nr:transcription-repair coupling factor [Vampirovibrionales bacterium]
MIATKTNASHYLLYLLRQTPWVRHLLQSSQDSHVENLANPSVKALLLAALFEETQKPLVVICPEPQAALKYQIELSQYLDENDIQLYPTEEFSPYDLSVFPVLSLKQQYQILNCLKDRTPAIYLVSPKSLLVKHLAIETLEAYAIELKVGQDLGPEALTEQCLAIGYLRASLIMDPGEFSSRGDIFDLYPISGKPVRIEFFGDTIETIRVIDVENQRSVEQADTVRAIPRAGIILSPENREKLPLLLQKRLDRQKKVLDSGAKTSSIEYEGLQSTIENQIQALEQAFLPDGIDYYGPLLHADEFDGYKTIVDYLPPEALLVMDDWQVLANNLAGLSDRLHRECEEGIQKGRLLDLGFEYHTSDVQAFGKLRETFPKQVFLDTLPLNADGQLPGTSGLSVLNLDLSAPDQFKANMRLAVEQFQKFRREGFKVFITTDYPQRVLDACQEGDTPATYWPDEGLDESSFSQATSDVVISKSGPLHGFVLSPSSDTTSALRLVHYTDGELYGRKQKKHITKSERTHREDLDVINAVQELRPGDYVVHRKHGIGRYLELTKIVIDRETREYLTIEYASNDRLHVPVEQVNLLSRYRGAGEGAPKLNKMGGIEWNKVKSKVKKSIQVIAKDLQKLYAARAKSRGHMFDADTPWQVEMEEAFPYNETPDQWQAILDTKSDMESDRPMDRLICGDVGFGKTEVALRALFKSVLSGKQAALLAPTTILVQQHFNTLVERFKPYPVRLGLLSRFRSPKEQKEVVQRLNMGECDIVVGTHRLLQKDVRFKNLGLVVIDEEQRFGVAHKEKLKQLRTEVDVLTLSATPIPRTLYMALSGIREMSLINTPPTNRAPIRTFVGPYNPAQIRMAILQEVDRGGQVYFLHNRVQTIYEKVAELQSLVPEVRFIVGHGQMNEHELENVMLDFAQHQFDVLVCTTIIESGLDIPNTNTIIIDRADRFGLSQLYQIRGRVGRSNVQAYAYCYYDPERQLTQDAKERLRAIREFTTLGSGYQIALRDLEIRGVGNILGSEQHGHMIAVGFDLYCQMLEEALHEAQGEIVEEKEDSIIDLNVTAFIPDAWVGDRNVKMSEYKRLADIDSELSIEIISAEWKDRFGDIPPETLQLLVLVRLRIMATELSIPLVRADEEYLRISVPYTLQEWMYLQKQLPADLGRKARWVPGVTSKQGSTPTLLIKHLGMDADEQVAFIMEFFKHLKKIVDKARDGINA